MQCRSRGDVETERRRADVTLWSVKQHRNTLSRRNSLLILRSHQPLGATVPHPRLLSNVISFASGSIAKHMLYHLPVGFMDNAVVAVEVYLRHLASVAVAEGLTDHILADVPSFADWR